MACPWCMAESLDRCSIKIGEEKITFWLEATFAAYSFRIPSKPNHSRSRTAVHAWLYDSESTKNSWSSSFRIFFQGHHPIFILSNYVYKDVASPPSSPLGFAWPGCWSEEACPELTLRLALCISSSGLKAPRIAAYRSDWLKAACMLWRIWYTDSVGFKSPSLFL